MSDENNKSLPEGKEPNENDKQFEKGNELRSQISVDIKEFVERADNDLTLKTIFENDPSIIPGLASIQAKEDNLFKIDESTGKNLTEAITYSKLILLNVQLAVNKGLPIKVLNSLETQADENGRAEKEYTAMFQTKGKTFSIQTRKVIQNGKVTFQNFSLSHFSEMEDVLAEQALLNSNIPSDENFHYTFGISGMTMSTDQSSSNSFRLFFPDPAQKLNESYNYQRSKGFKSADSKQNGIDYLQIQFLNLGAKDAEFIKALERSTKY